MGNDMGHRERSESQSAGLSRDNSDQLSDIRGERVTADMRGSSWTCDKDDIDNTGDTTEIWGSDEENIDVHAHLQRTHAKQGYLDGLTHLKEASLQKGFDTGFPQGAQLGRAVGQVLARLHGTAAFDGAKQRLGVASVLDKKYFDDQLDLVAKEHPLIAELCGWRTRGNSENAGNVG